MIMIQQRDAQIIELLNKGNSYKKIAQIFDLSVGRVRQIVIKDKIEKTRAKTRSKIFNDINYLDDINQKWIMKDLIYSLQFTNRSTTLLIRYFEDRDKTYPITGLKLK